MLTQTSPGAACRAAAGCPDDNDVLAFFEGTLGAAAAADLERHMDGCAGCRRLFSRVARSLRAEERGAGAAAGAPRPGPTTGGLADPDGSTLPDATAARGTPLRPGSMVSHFEVIRMLGHGGMGEVYLARDSWLGRKVALKMMRSGVLSSRTAVERFMFEARTTARFNHPHIVTIYEVGEDRDRPYVVLEYLRGQSLRDRLKRGPRPAAPEVLRVGQAVAEALEEAHAAGILHRDLKPANVFLCSDGRPRVLDFGLAKSFEPDEVARLGVGERSTPDAADPFVSAGGAGICGSPAYMSPEQWRGQETTGATDIWALGVLLHQMLGGALPFQASSLIALRRAVCSEEPALSLPTPPDGFAGLVADCLRKDSERRPPAGRVAARLRELLAAGGARPASAEGLLAGPPSASWPARGPGPGACRRCRAH